MIEIKELVEKSIDFNNWNGDLDVFYREICSVVEIEKFGRYVKVNVKIFLFFLGLIYFDVYVLR